MGVVKKGVPGGLTVVWQNITDLGQFANDDDTKYEILKLSKDSFDDEVRAKSLSVIGILERFPSLLVPFETFLFMLPPMRVRQ